jgi:hypothetical protein
MFCCANCFSDSFLASQINVIGKEKGHCSFCGSNDKTLIDPQVLIDYFEPLFGIYEKDKDGQLLNRLLQDDWALFSISSEDQQRSLIDAITKNSILSKTKFKPKYEKDNTNIEQWHLFSKELMHENRFHPHNAPDKSLFEVFGSLLGEVYKKDDRKFYRARINEEGKNFEIKDMQKPPSNIVLNGRANPIGIPYLYVTSNAETAIAELRGYKGELVTVIEFSIKENLDFFNLRDPKNTISPFEKIDDIEFIYKHMPYLNLLGNELSKPVVPSKANLEYLSTQYLCEMIKHIGYHGIIYKSSIAEGDNYVIFADNRLSFGKMSQYRITEMLFKSELVT